MDDKSLADAVAVLLGAERGQGPTSDRWFLHREGIEQYLGFNNKELVRDPRVAMALIKTKCWGCNIVRKGDEWEAHVVPIGQIREFTARHENPERAICKACVESLT